MGLGSRAAHYRALLTTQGTPNRAGHTRCAGGCDRWSSRCLPRAGQEKRQRQRLCVDWPRSEAERRMLSYERMLLRPPGQRGARLGTVEACLIPKDSGQGAPGTHGRYLLVGTGLAAQEEAGTEQVRATRRQMRPRPQPWLRAGICRDHLAVQNTTVEQKEVQSCEVCGVTATA